MADRYWLGVSGDFTATANWSTTRYGAGGSAAPVDTNDVYILDGTIDITANLNQTGIDCNSLTIGGKFTANIGGAGTSLIIGCSGVTQITLRAGQYINLTAGDDAIDDLRVTQEGPAGTAIGASLRLTGGTFTSASLGENVTCEITGTPTVTTLNLANVASLLVGIGATLTTVNAHDSAGRGFVECWSAVGTLNLNMVWNQRRAGTATAINAYDRARLLWDSSGTITAATGYSGARLTAGSVPFIVTNCVEWVDAQVFTNSDAAVTFSNAKTFIGKRS